MARTHVLYRFYSATGQLLYIGITMNPPERFKSHRDSKEWWKLVSGITVENYLSREELAQAERRAIQVEHPLHNVVHAKPATIPQRELVEPPAQEPAHSPLDLLGSLFGRKCRETRYGYVSEEEYERRRAEGRAKEQGRRDCPLCDVSGYRPNGYLCDHIDHNGDSRLAAARRRAQKERLQVVQGGGTK